MKESILNELFKNLDKLDFLLWMRCLSMNLFVSFWKCFKRNVDEENLSILEKKLGFLP